MNKKIFLAIVYALVVVSIALYPGREYTRTEYYLDTVITIKANNKKAVDECFLEIARLDKMLNAHSAESDVFRINSSQKGESVEVSAETCGLIRKANEYKALTDGAFDISIKPVSDLWDIKNGGHVPNDDELQRALSLKGDILVDGNTVTLTKDGMQIDLGGIAKGYIGDRVRDILKKHNVKSAIADLGGNIVAVGDNNGKPWIVGLQNPTEKKGTTFGAVKVYDKSVVTSGGYERYFEKDGKIYHHILDTQTGRNPENDILSVTVIAQDGALADALSTSFMVMGKDKALELAENNGVEAIVYTKNGIYKTPKTEVNK